MTVLLDYNITVLIETSTTRLKASWGLDVAVGIVLRLGLHGVRHRDFNGDDPLALDVNLAIPTVPITLAGTRRFAALRRLRGPG